MKKILSLLLTNGVLSLPRVPVSGTYNYRELYDSSFCQLTLDVEKNRADIDIILNDYANEDDLIYPKF
jgi:hypothetical protein